MGSGPHQDESIVLLVPDQQPIRGTDQIAVKIQHKDRLLTDPGAIEDILAVENDVVPFDRADVPQQPRGPI